MRVILTSRPLSVWKPISWINWITQVKTRSPFDHVVIEHEGIVYESTAGIGVRKIEFEKWKIGRNQSYLFCFDISETKVDFRIFEILEGNGYDVRANLIYFFAPRFLLKKLLKKRSNERLFCSELVAEMLGLEEPYVYTPKDIALYCDRFDHTLKMDLL